MIKMIYLNGFGEYLLWDLLAQDHQFNPISTTIYLNEAYKIQEFFNVKFN
jgi:hypothetical protein